MRFEILDLEFEVLRSGRIVDLSHATSHQSINQRLRTVNNAQVQRRDLELERRYAVS